MMCTMKRCVALLGLFVLVLASAVTASATGLVQFDVRSDRVSVTKTGRSEVLGNLTMTADPVCGGTPASGACTSQGGNIEILYAGVQIDNSNSTGITVCETIAGVTKCIPPNGSGTYLNGFVTVTNIASGGLLTIGVNNGIKFAAGDQVLVEGVRGRIDLSFANTPFGASGAEIDAFLTPSPSTIASFFPSQGPVGFSFDGMTISTDAASILECIGKGSPNVHVSELYPSSFVDNGFGPRGSLPADPRVGVPPPNTFGATANTQVHLVVANLPSGVTLTWPATSSTDEGAGGTGSQLFLVSQSASGDSAIYVFQTPDQVGTGTTPGSDQFIETWTIGSGADGSSESGGASCDADDICVTLSGTDADFGTATVGAQLYPPAGSGLRPRYHDPLHPGGVGFLTVGPCTTSLLFPWVVSGTAFGFDTGIAIANTSKDPFGAFGATQEHGTCTLWGFPKGEGTPVSLTTEDVSTGDTVTRVLSQTVFNGFEGYIIARCNFQFAHGFAFLTNNFGTGMPSTVGQGYIALVIPDPLVIGGRIAADSSEAADCIGEGGTFIGEGFGTGEGTSPGGCNSNTGEGLNN